MTERSWLVARPPGLPLSFRLERRVPPVLLVITGAILATVVLSVGIGEYSITPLDVVRTVLGRESASGEDHDFIVNVLRLPRALVAVAVGVGLGVSGAILQGLTRNPLAAPSVLGITQGAGLVAVLAAVALPGVSSDLLPVFALSGAALAAALVYLLAWSGGVSPSRLLLVGIGVAAVAGALTTLVVTFGNVYQVQPALVWLVGSVRGRGWDELWALLPWLVVFLPLALLGSRALNTLSLGDAVARSLGSRVELERGLLLLTSVALAGAAVAAAGTVGFVGLMAPHLARRLVGPGHEGVLPTAALLGGLIVSAADLVGRTVLAPVEIPAGIVTAILGTPYFIYLLYRGGTA